MTARSLDQHKDSIGWVPGVCVRVRLSAKVGVGSVRRMCKGLGYGGCMLVECVFGEVSVGAGV